MKLRFVLRNVTSAVLPSTKWIRFYASKMHVALDTPSVFISFSPVNDFQMNQYLLGCKKTGTAALVDCGDKQFQRWIDTAKQQGLTIQHLLQTHAHVDHIYGLKATKDALPECPIYLHFGDKVWYNEVEMQGRMYGMRCPQPPEPEVELKDGDNIKVGDIELEVIHVPGHCPGQVSFYSKKHKFMICGDLLFQGSIGRTDFPHCSHKAMIASLKRVMKLPDDTLVCPGHMFTTTIGEERRNNMFVADLK
jgi:glyoxylase-like metal-dependent hydrolase (beta-lactamase superfamily II)